MTTSRPKDFAEDVAFILRHADGEQVFGRTMDLTPEQVVAMIREVAERCGISHRHIESTDAIEAHS